MSLGEEGNSHNITDDKDIAIGFKQLYVFFRASSVLIIRFWIYKQSTLSFIIEKFGLASYRFYKKTYMPTLNILLDNNP